MSGWKHVRDPLRSAWRYKPLRLLAFVMFYSLLGCLFVTMIAAGAALSLDLSQFRYAVY